MSEIVVLLTACSDNNGNKVPCFHYYQVYANRRVVYFKCKAELKFFYLKLLGVFASQKAYLWIKKCNYACRSAYCDAQLPPENLREFLPRLIPVILVIHIFL